MRNILRKLARFFRRHWKAIAITAVVLTLLTIAITFLANSFKNNSTNEPADSTFVGNSGGTKMVTVDGNSVSVFEKKEDAEANPITVLAGVKSMTVNGDNATLKSSLGTVNHLSENNYELDLNGISDGSKVTLTVTTGGDGSFFGQRLGSDVETHYLSIVVSNPSDTGNDVSSGNTAGSSGTADSSNETGSESSTTDSSNVAGVPTGTVHFGESLFQTYGSEAEAQAAVSGKQQKFTITTSMAKNLMITAEPSAETARIWASVCMVDGEDENGARVRMNDDSNWSATFDLTQYAGHQVTIVLKAENGMAFSTGYAYVSFFVPQFEAEKGEDIPPVVDIE